MVELFREVQKIKMNQFRYCITLLILLPLIGCVKNEIEDPFNDQSRQYLPLVQGKYIAYAVDSIVFDDEAGGNRMDTVHFEIREEIFDFQFVNGDTIYYLHRFRRDAPETNWQLTDVWTTRYTINEALRTEENLTFRKMVFPLKDGKKWIATSYINPSTTVLIGTENVQAFQDWESEVVEFDIADQVGQFSFGVSNVMHIVQTDSDDGSTKRYVMEKYARGIGLVQRIDTILDSRCIVLGDFTPCIGKSWLEHAGKGYILSQVMIDHN